MVGSAEYQLLCLADRTAFFVVAIGIYWAALYALILD